MVHRWEDFDQVCYLTLSCLATMTEPTVTFIRKAKGRPGNTRKRAAEDEPKATVPANSEVYRAPRKQELNPLIQSSSGFRSKKRARTNEAQSDSDDDLDAKDHKDVGVRYSSKRSVNPGKPRSESPEIRTAEDAAALTELSKPGQPDDKLYRGSKNYTSQLPTGNAKFGAVAGPANVRTITVTDYQVSLFLHR